MFARRKSLRLNAGFWARLRDKHSFDLEQGEKQARGKIIEQNDFESIYDRSELAKTNFGFVVAGDVVVGG